MKKIIAVACFAVSSAAYAEVSQYEFSIVSQFTDATSASIMAQVPTKWTIRPGLELGSRMYWGIDSHGEWETYGAGFWGVSLSQQRTLVQDYAFNATVALGVTHVHGRRVTDAPNDFRDENIPYMNLRMGLSTNNNDNFIPEIGVSLLSHYGRKAMFIDTSSTAIQPDDVGMYAKIGFRF